MTTTAIKLSRRLVFILLITAGLFLLPKEVVAQPAPTAAFEEADCWFESPLDIIPGLEQSFRCGYVTVPERHDAPEGPTIRIPVAILAATSANPQPDPLFLTQGGPGGDAFEVFPVLIANSMITDDRDVVIINQRGTNYGEPNLLCPETVDVLPDVMGLTTEAAEEQELAALGACFERLQEEGVDLAAFNSIENAADIEAVRAALGYETFNFYGVSYGTLLGLHLIRYFPENLRSAILDGVVPTDLNFIPQVTLNTDRVFTEILNTCEADPECRAQYPNLEERFFALVDELNAEPVFLTIEDPDVGTRVRARLDGDALVNVLFQAFYLPDAYASFPKLVSDLEAGDYTFIRAVWPVLAFDRTFSTGMYFSVICSEDADFVPSEAPLEGVRPYFAENAEEDLQSYLDACALWEVDLLPSEVDDPVVSDVPVLLLSGQYDPITPPSFADVAAASLENRYVVVHPTGSHGVAFDNECLDSIVMQFLQDPNSAPNVTCLDNIEQAPFVPVDALTLPFLIEVNQLTESMWTQLAVGAVFVLGILSAFLVFPIAWLVRTLQRKGLAAFTDDERRARRLRWWGALVALLFGLLALVFIGGAGYYTFEALFSGLANAYSISGAAGPFFVIPYLLVVLAVLLAVITVLGWRRGMWSNWWRIYFALLAICAVGYVFVLAYGEMMSVLLL